MTQKLTFSQVPTKANRAKCYNSAEQYIKTGTEELREYAMATKVIFASPK